MENSVATFIHFPTSPGMQGTLGETLFNYLSPKINVESLKNYVNTAFNTQGDVVSVKPNVIDKWVSSYQPTQTESARLAAFLDVLKHETIDLEKLKELSRRGIPEAVRSPVWKLLLGYIPCQKRKQKEVFTRKRAEYRSLTAKHYPKIIDNASQEANPLWDQIYVDVIRTFPIGIEDMFLFKEIQGLMCRVLYVYSVEFQAGNYWQGLNELPVPFLLTFLSCYTNCSLRQLNVLQEECVRLALQSGSVEADVFWCLTYFMDSLQIRGDYVIGKNGEITQTKILQRFENLCAMVDPDLKDNLDKKGVEFIFFAFRWMVCLLIRELPIHVIMRIWDCYFVEGDDTLSFHLYTALSFFVAFSKEIQACRGFEDTLLFVQRIPTEHWTELHAEYLIKCAQQMKKIDQYYEEKLVQISHVTVSSLLSAVSYSLVHHPIGE